MQSRFSTPSFDHESCQRLQKERLTFVVLFRLRIALHKLDFMLALGQNGYSSFRHPNS